MGATFTSEPKPIINSLVGTCSQTVADGLRFLALSGGTLRLSVRHLGFVFLSLSLCRIDLRSAAHSLAHALIFLVFVFAVVVLTILIPALLPP